MKKEKMIEEMAKDLRLIKEFQTSDIYTTNYQEAMSLISLGYRKVPEGAVVLTKDELAKHDEKVSKEAAMEVLKKVDDESNGQTIMVTNYIRKKYGVEVEE